MHGTGIRFFVSWHDSGGQNVNLDNLLSIESILPRRQAVAELTKPTDPGCNSYQYPHLNGLFKRALILPQLSKIAVIFLRFATVYDTRKVAG
jgi:hypothetical protein